MNDETVTRIGISNLVIEDLARSDLEPTDIGARSIGPAEIASTKTPTIQGRPPAGYVIPYVNMQGEPVKFYRLKLLEGSTVDGDALNYRQPTGEPNHIYFPPRLPELLKSFEKGIPPYFIITEGEKKAACAVKKGFPTIAVTGVDSWRTRRVLLPKDTKLIQRSDGQLAANIPSGTGSNVSIQDSGSLAIGLPEFIDWVVQRKIPVIIIYDSDGESGVKIEVQRAAATLGYELRFKGLPITHIRQLVLPAMKQKVGLDDFLVRRGAADLHPLIRATLLKRVAFPRHPNPIAYIGSRLQKSKMTRKEVQDVSMSILAELESKGRRFRTVGSDQLHYFDEESRTLYPVQLSNQRIPLHETPFGAYVYRNFNLGGADKRVVEWLAAQFSGEDPIDTTETHQVLTRVKQEPYSGYIAYQTSDSSYVIITPNPDEPFLIKANGTHGLLFEQGQVEGISLKELEVKFYEHLDKDPHMYWLDVLKQLRVRPQLNDDGEPRASEEQMRQLVALLYYISPWLRRWRNTQLPVELVIGEAGSGKSSLLSLRQRILTGKPYLSNLTTDMRNWWAGVTARGGIYVMDNVHFSGKHSDFRQQLSDELCRLVTDPDPHVEMRRLYTTNEIITLPIHPTFAVTSIEQPFFQADLLQRSLIFELDAIRTGHDSDWLARQMARAGGRVGWIAHHLVAIHRFMHSIYHNSAWNENYGASHRLANYEQSLVVMGKTFGIETDWIPSALVSTTEGQITEADWVHRGLQIFVAGMMQAQPDDYFQRRWSVAQISEWMEGHEALQKNPLLTNAWRLGRYIQSHRQQIEQSLKLFQDGKKANKFVYGIYRHDQ